MDDLKFSVCIPTYNRGGFIGETIKGVLAQTYANYEIVISDNNSQDDTEDVVKGFKDKRIRYFRNESNAGFTGNLELCKQRSSGDVLYLLSDKNIIAKDALMKLYRAFKLSDDIGAVVLPYYWYGRDAGTPVRAKPLYDKDKDAIISIESGEKAVIAVFSVVDNPSAFALRKKYIDLPFHEDSFVEFVYPFASIFKRRKVVFLKDYTMACPAFVPSGSQKSFVYMKSPVQNWVDLFNAVFFEKEFEKIRKGCVKNFVAVNYVGLAQVKNYGSYKALFREIYYLIRYRWENILSLKFWFFSAGAVIIPAFALKKVVYFYKNRVNSGLLKNVKPLNR